ncbi:BolA family protein [Nevskia ramosa]|uniref:BolA family protein n=1 Tax=Nevskia ramosa TaxID=64002 RepID=UPI0003B711C4|nr:BolA/IbaG family iron-sulfur metabolism protein [Nevskia ramosa]
MAMMTKEQIKALLDAGLPGAVIEVKGDDGQHFEADVSWSGFAGLSMVKQHQAVYAALGEKMGREIHALALKTRAA